MTNPEQAPVLSAVASFIAGHETQVFCDADTNNQGIPGRPGYDVAGWAVLGGSEIHLHSYLCDNLQYGPANAVFPEALGTLIHEAAHAKGIRSEACAELYADRGVYTVLDRFWHVPFFSPLSRRVAAKVLDATRQRPADYQPTLSSCD